MSISPSAGHCLDDELEDNNDADGDVSGLALIVDGTLVMASHANRWLSLWDAVEGTLLATSRECGMVQSMSRAGDCWDNAVAESFFATLCAELVDHERYDTARAAERSIGDYIDNFYNVERLHSHLDYVSPIEFELRMHIAAIAA